MKPDKRYPINDCYPTIQGEGGLCGTPMTLLRFQGCPVGCPWCDTKETWELDAANERPNIQDALGTSPLWAKLGPDEIVELVHQFALPSKWVLITGGEPALYTLRPVVDALHKANYLCALETSGTAKGFLSSEFDYVTVSPKWAMPGGKTVQMACLAASSEIKQVIGKPADLTPLLEALATEELAEWIGRVSLQPVSQSEKATKLCLEYAFQYGFSVSLQVHKLLQVR